MTDSNVCEARPATSYVLKRRGHYVGELYDNGSYSVSDELKHWRQGKPVLLNGACLTELAKYDQDIAQSHRLYCAILDEEECDSILAERPYADRLDGQFESLGSSYNEGDEQEIERVLFDAVEGEKILAEDLWLKVSWLSFYEHDASLRFRFSFGVDNVEDVAADTQRQHYAALLTDAVFPESRLITQNEALIRQLHDTLNSTTLNFVERIIYFNSADGGAYFHHDRERGHAGVVYTQVSGSTFWLALPKQELMQEITDFVAHCGTNNSWPEKLACSMRDELIELSSNAELLSSELESFANSSLIHLMNETEMFVQKLIRNGHGRVVHSGDVLLLPQETDRHCCWHSVFCLGEEAGEALSFAIRKT